MIRRNARRLGFFPVALSALTLLSLTTGAASAATIYTTGFESPVYTAGSLNGQDGWVATGGGVFVSTIFQQSGAQDVIMGGASQTATHLDIVGGSPTVDVTANLNFVALINPWTFQILSPGGPVAGVTVQTDGSLSFLGGGILPAGTIAPATYYTFDIVGNFASNTYSVLLNGITKASGLAFNAAGLNTYLGGQFLNPSGAGGVLALDNYTVNTITGGGGGPSVPEPSTLVEFLGGLVMLGTGKLKRRSKS